ncbi:MAG: LysM peptidoglycan-binding domain-containing protein [Acidimicrobiales bacterium]
MTATVVPDRSSDRSPAAHGAGTPPRPRLVVLEGGRSRAGLVSSSSCRPARLALATLPLLFVLASWLDGGASLPTQSAREPIAATVGDAYVVQPGDTLWAIARRLDPDGDVRATVDRLVGVHGSTTVTVGDRIPLDDFVPTP